MLKLHLFPKLFLVVSKNCYVNNQVTRLDIFNLQKFQVEIFWVVKPANLHHCENLKSCIIVEICQVMSKRYKTYKMKLQQS